MSIERRRQSDVLPEGEPEWQTVVVTPQTPANALSILSVAPNMAAVLLGNILQ